MELISIGGFDNNAFNEQFKNFACFFFKGC
jgi:hypothetical protein